MQGTMAGAQLQSVSAAWCIASSTMGTLHGSQRGAGIRRPGRPPTPSLPCRPLPAVQEQRAGLQGGKQQQQRPGGGAGGGAGRRAEGCGRWLQARHLPHAASIACVQAWEAFVHPRLMQPRTIAACDSYTQRLPCRPSPPPPCPPRCHAVQKRVQKKQQVVLTRDVPGLGSEGSLKAVPTGYWRNYLQPQGLAAFADDNILEQVR